jgi:catechol 2,3-dioxygenase-like lactoylglutathione lyase family enzyme
MEDTNPSFDGEIPDISEIAFVVSDLEADVDRYGRIFGLDEWRLYRFEPPTFEEPTLRGEPRDHAFDVGLASTGSTIIELVEPTDGESLFSEHLAENGPGLHHIAYYPYDDPHDMKDSFEAAGMPVIQSGVYGGMEFWFFDTREELGVIFETVSGVDNLPEADFVYSGPSDVWPL